MPTRTRYGFHQVSQLYYERDGSRISAGSSVTNRPTRRFDDEVGPRVNGRWPNRECRSVKLKFGYNGLGWSPEIGGGLTQHFINRHAGPDSAMNYLNWIVPLAKSSLHIPADFQANDDFELLPFLFDLDSTIAMFTKRFVKQISHGAVEWGILPFVSDVKALWNSVQDLAYRLDIEQLSKDKFELTLPFSCGSSSVSYPEFSYFDGKLRLGGYKYWEPPSADELAPMYLQILLDELGVHPDLKTVWDIIPLSFVADYYLPIGSYLDSIHPRGWFNPKFNVRGSWSLKGEAKILPSTSYYDFLVETNAYTTWEFYYRAKTLPPTLGTRPLPRLPEFQAPSARQLFNTAYLARASFNRRARRVSRKYDDFLTDWHTVFGSSFLGITDIYKRHRRRPVRQAR